MDRMEGEEKVFVTLASIISLSSILPVADFANREYHQYESFRLARERDRIETEALHIQLEQERQAREWLLEHDPEALLQLGISRNIRQRLEQDLEINSHNSETLERLLAKPTDSLIEFLRSDVISDPTVIDD